MRTMGVSRVRAWLVTAALAGMTAIGPAEAGAEDAESMIRKASSSRQVGNAIQTIRLVRTSASGQTDTKVLQTHTRTVDGLEQSHAVIVEPEPLKGVQFLRLQRSGDADVTWTYLPAGESLNEIAGSRKAQQFMGTDFSYEDLELGDVDAGVHELLGDETITIDGAEVACHKISTIPRSGFETAYGKLETWVEQGTLLPRQILLYAPDGVSELKRLTFETFAFEGARTPPTLMRMENLERETSTVLEVTDYKLDVAAEELPESLFDPRRLAENS